MAQRNYEEIYDEIRRGWGTACLSDQAASSERYRPAFVSNDRAAGKKVFTVIEDELKSCETFIISVAFITKGGIAPLLMTLKELEERGIAGKVLTTDYQTFSEPDALDKLAGLKNIELKMYRTEKSEGFHTKGYIFSKEGINIMIIGSSNMTSAALTKNKEWNTRIVSTKRGELSKNVLEEFEKLWEADESVDYKQYKDEYRHKYNIVKQQKAIALKQQVIDLNTYKLKPNRMQLKFLNNLEKIRDRGESRALLVSSCGTGKTYASAFAMRDEKPEKALFLVHREEIARQAMESYGKVFGDSKSRGLLTGNSKDYNADITFATMQTMAKDENLKYFGKTYFDCIIVDEVHRAGAPTYQKIMNWFKPELWLGMTASPERTDDFDIFSLFNHNLACEIRLKDAMEEELLCPFHYFGIAEFEANGKVFNDKNGFKQFNNIERENRVDFVLEKAEYFGYSGDRLRGLVFCSRVAEADFMAKAFKKRGYRTASLSGEDNPSKREENIERLMMPESEEALDYIFTVDIFNEGVDIPKVNQIIMLRPTESPIVFVQQLGRGLRKSDQKEYVVVLDFIGNYDNNYLIPTALSGDRSYNKDNMRRYVESGNRVIPGASTVHFDEISRKRIYNSIDSAKTNTIGLIKSSYKNLKYKLGRIPHIKDFGDYGEIEISKIFERKGSYHAFLKQYEKEYDIVFTEEQEKVLEFLSVKIARAKRPHEIVLLDLILRGEEEELIKKTADELYREYNITMSEDEKDSLISVMTNNFLAKQQQEKFDSCVFIEGSYEFTISKKYKEMLKNADFTQQVKELIDYSKDIYNNVYRNKYEETNLVLGEKYSYEDVCHILNWKKNMNAQNIGGYFYDKETKTLPVFINYEKSEDAIKYEDRFVSPSRMIALSKHPRKIDSPDADHIYKRTPEDKENKIYLFVRKNKDDKEAKEFYFLGEIFAEGNPIPVIMEETETNAFEIKYRLETAVREDLYNYFIRA